MKSQNDLIFSIVSVVLAVIFAAVFFFTKREPVKPADPTPVPLGTPQFAPGSVVMSNTLPGGGGGSGGGGDTGAGGPGPGPSAAGFDSAGGGGPAKGGPGPQLGAARAD